MNRYKLVVFTFLILLVLPSAIIAQTDVTDDDVNRVAKELFCPTCESIPVDVCPTEVCADWRAEIRRQLEAGATDGEVLQSFATRYGSAVLANPPARGIGVFFWIGPILVVLLGIFIFARQMQKLQTEAVDKSQPVRAEPEISTGDKYRDQIEKELRS
ncbi:MAG: cytochrome c-type biogenesis protein [Chloroflexota bacterium]